MKIVIIANKWWEAAPLVAVFQHVSPLQPEHSGAPAVLFGTSLPSSGSRASCPRLLGNCHGIEVEVWCLQDLMDPSENSSLTCEKARVLRRIPEWKAQNSLIIAFGTAASPTASDSSGNVVIGTSVFVHDPYPSSSESQRQWKHSQIDEVVRSTFEPRFDKLQPQFAQAEKRFLTAPNASAHPPRVIASSNLVSVGVVNVTNNTDFVWTDNQALEKFKEVYGGGCTESLETTHGVIRLVLDTPFMYISGIANTVGKFKEQAKANAYSQNFVAAHNAAMTLAWLVPELASVLRSQELGESSKTTGR